MCFECLELLVECKFIFNDEISFEAVINGKYAVCQLAMIIYTNYLKNYYR